MCGPFSLLSFTHSPSVFQIPTRSAKVKLVDTPLVVVVTKTGAPGQSDPLLTPILNFPCHPYVNSPGVIATPLFLTRHTASQIPFPTRHTTSGRCSAILCSRIGTPSSISFLLSMLALTVARATMFVLPTLYSSGSL